jgi:hypothetical protein
MRLAFRFCCIPLLLASGFAQSASSDTQLTQALLTEIHGLRQDLQTAAATIPRVQIVMFRVQTQAAISNRASQRLDDARSRCNQTRSEKKNVLMEIDRSEARLRAAQNPAEQRNAEETVARMKSAATMYESEEQQCQAREAEAETQARTEQTKMNDLQDQLDKLDKILAGLGAK